MCIIVSKSALHAGLLCMDFFRKGDVYREKTDEPHVQHPFNAGDAVDPAACFGTGDHHLHQGGRDRCGDGIVRHRSYTKEVAMQPV